MALNYKTNRLNKFQRKQITDLFDSGLSRKEIAIKIGTSTSTVQRHVRAHLDQAKDSVSVL